MDNPQVFGEVVVAAPDVSEDVFEMPTGGGFFSVRITNDTGSDATVKLSVSNVADTQSISGGKLLPNGFSVANEKVVELTGLAAQAAKHIVLESTIAGIEAIAYGAGA